MELFFEIMSFTVKAVSKAVKDPIYQPNMSWQLIPDSWHTKTVSTIIYVLQF